MSTVDSLGHPSTRTADPGGASVASDEIPPDVRAVSIATGAGRILIGLGLAASPEIAMRLLGFPRYQPETLVVSRIAGARDVVMGAATLLSLDDRDRLARANLANAAADAADSATFAVALAAGGELRGAAMRGLAAAAPATLVGAWVASRLRRRSA
jgi:hypothetical protein